MDIIFCAARAASSVVSVRDCSIADTVEFREIIVLKTTLTKATPIVARITITMIFV